MHSRPLRWAIALLLLTMIMLDSAVAVADNLFTNSTRRLQKVDRQMSRKGRGEQMAQKRKANRMNQFISTMMQESVPADFKPAPWSVAHSASKKQEAVINTP